MLGKRHLITLKEFSSEEIRFLLDEAKDFKKDREIYRRNAPLFGRTLIMLFQKKSTRTRVSAELAMTDLGGNSIFLGREDIHLGVKESIRDTALVLGRMAAGIMARVYDHQDLDELAKYAGVPIINALSDKFHPLQSLADLYTIEDHFRTLDDKRVAWVGDGNNVCQSLMIACAKMGVPMQIASPPGYEPLKEVLQYCKEIASNEMTISHDPKKAVSDADVIVTDTFISMGQENQKEEKLKRFKGFQVTSALTKYAKPDYIFMHCLPRNHEEVTDEIFYGPHSVVFDEAENRLYTVAAVLKNLLGART